MAVSLPDNYTYINLENNNDVAITSEEDVILDSLRNPIASKQLKYIVKKGETVCIIISDITRVYQNMKKYLPYIIEELNFAGVNDDDIIFLSATGTHRMQNEEEHKKLLGELYNRFKCIDHNAYDEDNLLYIGTTSYKTPVYINKVALKYDHIIITGSIVFHDMAGYGGGRKSILPGISGYNTIMANHSLSLHEKVGYGPNPFTTIAKLEGNPMNEDMLEACDMVKPSFMFNVIVNSSGKIEHAVSGNYREAFQNGCEYLKKSEELAIKDLADVVIASSGGYPKDINLYQATKALSSAKEAVREGGDIILIARCNEGMGHSEMESIINDFPDNYSREIELRRAYTIAKFIGFLMCKISEKCTISLVSEIDETLFRKTNIRVYKDINDAISTVLNKKGLVYIMPDAAAVLPIKVE